MDKFTYTTTYKQEFCVRRSLPGNDFPVSQPPPVKEVHEDCRGIFVPGTVTGLPPDPKSLRTCPCQAGGLLPPRGAIAKGLPTDLDKKCICFTCGNCARPPIKTKVAHGDPKKTKNPKVECQKQIPPAHTVEKNTDVISECAFVPTKTTLVKKLRPVCPSFEGIRPIARGKYGGQQPPRRNQGDGRCNGPPWLRQRRDERREPDVFRINRYTPRAEVPDIIHGEEARVRNGRWIRDQPQGGRRRVNASRSDVRIPGPFWNRRRPDERREVDCPRRRKFEHLTEVRDIIHGGEGSSGGRRYPDDLLSRCRPPSKTRIPGPFWMRDRADARREPDIDRKRRIEQRGEIPDVIHGEERRAQEWRENRDRRAEERRQIDPYDLPPGPSNADPFWLLERTDERRNPDMDRKRKFERQVIRSAEIIHGEDFRTRYDPPRRIELPRVLGPDPTDETIESDDDEAVPFPYRRPCDCGPGPARSGPDNWMLERDWGAARPGRAPVAPDAEEAGPPAARISCAPQADVANADQPNAFMRQLYQKYPYLYQVLRETPPEELASRVFKDKFLSTYQVDFLHMGIGQEQIPEGGAQVQERITGPDGEPEPQAIPGCSYRHGERGDFGRKKQEENKKEKEVPQEENAREEPRVSEYQATISRLGNEIVTDQLYRLAQITKNMKNSYKKM